MELSNKTLSMLLVAAIAVSLFGTLFSLNKLSTLSTTGYATQVNATAQVQINASTSIVFLVSSINWGSGRVNSSFTNCSMYTDGMANNDGCWGFATVSSPLVIENDGNVNVTLQLATNATATTFIGGSSGGGPKFMYKIADNESSSCTSAAPTAYTDVNTTYPGTTICAPLAFDNTKDTVKINVYVNIPDDAVTTTATRVAIFRALAS